MQLIRDALEQEFVLLDVHENELPAVFRATLRLLVQRGVVASDGVEEVQTALEERESAGSTAIGHGVAAPHAYVGSIQRQAVVFVRLAHAVNFGAPDGVPTRFFFFLLGPPESAARHLDTLMHVARLATDDEFRYAAGLARDGRELNAALEAFDAHTAAVAPSAPAPRKPLEYTGIPFGGVLADIRRRLPYYASDFRDGLNLKSISSTLFLYFACLAPAITFGGMMSSFTGQSIGAVEMLAATAACGVIYAVFSGQPLIILGGTGPLLVFTGMLYRQCQAWDVPFLSTYAWVGVWTAGFVLLMAAADASCLMRFFTRFTDEIFSGLISIIFIYEAVRALVAAFQDLDEKQHHDTALLTLLLALGTFYIAISLSRFRRSSYLVVWMREFLADFGPTIALAAMTMVAVWLHEVFLERLPAPDVFATTSGRPWRVDLWEAPIWVRFAAIGPALLVSVLVFLDQNITARLVNSPDHKLQKGEAYHLDLAIVGVLIGCCSMLGLPWLVAATVRSLNHVRSLATTEEVVSQGTTRESIIHVRENRVTSLAIHLLIGASLLLLPWLKEIPLAVLYGLFLFMGVVSIAGNQFFERLSLWIKDPDLYPATHYIRRVPIRVVHAFTFVQVVSLAVLWAVKASAVGILFPLFIAVLAPLRFLLGRYFDAKHLEALDADEEPEEEAEHFT